MSRSVQQLENSDARQLILHLQGLTRTPHAALKNGELADLIYQLGFVQMDSIRHVERAHHMILFARNQTYRTKHLQKLHEKEAGLFENWTHDASLIPVEFWKYWKHKFARQKPDMTKRFLRWQGAGFLDRTELLIEKARIEGGVRSRDLEKPKGQKLEMWQWHDGKAALEFLWRTGELAVPRREGFQKVYDLAHKTIPQEHFEAEVSVEEFIDWACRSAVERLGIFSAGDISRYWELVTIAEVNDWLNGPGSDLVVPIEVQEFDRTTWRKMLARKDLAELTGTIPKIPERLRILSPFDPVTRDRKRLSWLFGFDYTIEIYVPPEKRKYGYYVYPILEKDRLIGRVDCQAKRDKDSLIVDKVWLEPKVKWSTARNNRFEAELTRQARLANVSQIDWNAERIIDQSR